VLARQEYYTAIALLNTALLPIAPWKFTSWWSNVLKLGDEMGLGFRRNMLRYDSALMTSLMTSLMASLMASLIASSLFLCCRAEPRGSKTSISI